MNIRIIAATQEGFKTVAEELNPDYQRKTKRTIERDKMDLHGDKRSNPPGFWMPHAKLVESSKIRTAFLKHFRKRAMKAADGHFVEACMAESMTAELLYLRKRLKEVHGVVALYNRRREDIPPHMISIHVDEKIAKPEFGDEECTREIKVALMFARKVFYSSLPSYRKSEKDEHWSNE